MAITWNPADKSASITLSNGNLTASSTINAEKMVRATGSVSSGKWYFEFSYTTFPYGTGEALFGVAQSGHSLSAYIGQFATGWGIDDGSYKYNETYSPYGTDGYDGAVFMCALDMDAGKIWFGLDGTWFESGNPASGAGAAFTNVTGTVYPACTPYDATSITARFTAASQSYTPPTGFSAIDSEIAAVSHVLPAASLTWTAQNPQSIYDPSAIQSARYLYRAYLTGDDESPPVADLELPVASFQSTRRNGEQTYLVIVVPNPVPYIDGINARLNGDVVIMSGFAIGDNETLTELIRVNLSSFRYDLGPRSASATLTGYKQVTYASPKRRVLRGISYKSVTDGARRVRCEPDMWLNPGDTADIGDGETFVVDSISYTINPRQASMECAEVSA